MGYRAGTIDRGAKTFLTRDAKTFLRTNFTQGTQKSFRSVRNCSEEKFESKCSQISFNQKFIVQHLI